MMRISIGGGRVIKVMIDDEDQRCFYSFNNNENKLIIDIRFSVYNSFIKGN